MLTSQTRASVLVEALPYIRRFHGRTVVLKYGGHAMLNEEVKTAVLTDVVLMHYVGIRPVIVHGGGPEITAMLQRLGIPSRFVNGLRITDRETMEVVEMVLVGRLNKDIVARINRLGGRAVGLSGKDANLIEARKLSFGGEEEDLGFVGEVAAVNPAVVKTLVGEGYIPVVAPVGGGADGETYNINADHVAGRLAAALGADKLLLLTDVPGILARPDDPDSLLSTIRSAEIPALIAAGKVRGGMIPKVECCLAALEAGVGSAHILDGRVPHAVLLELFADHGIGTMVLP
ncbi:MAG: acetylglutamate kinase [Firmicutes bacterium]|nr:acetylglutamate kinase [Bacillota bacterium]